ncbi:hypothetical protein RJ641_012808 [Dillenia turbinata]|uniref:Uncharacterized protein n=1 Tax=Dillenia turbinata TaxID=194707 RepID=A0AAN8V2V3_9MAGN
MQAGAEAVHQVNPDLLAILSGLSYDLDLSFIKDRPVSLTFSNKLVYEMHWYSWSDDAIWDSNAPAVCNQDKDVDWAVWALTGSYYFREGVAGMEEFFGILNYDWSDVRNSKYLDSLKTIMPPRTGPAVSLVSAPRMMPSCKITQPSYKI